MSSPMSRQPPTSWLTLSNALTSMRLIAAPFFCALIAAGSWGAAFTIFWLAVVSDLLDGRLARARNETSAFGGILDHGSDATFVTLGNLALATSGVVPLLLPIVIVAAFVQYALDSRILSGRALRTSRLGRWNGILYFFPAGIVVTREVLGLASPGNAVVFAIGWILVVSTSISMIDRLWNLLAARAASASGS